MSMGKKLKLQHTHCQWGGGKQAYIHGRFGKQHGEYEEG